MPPGWDRAKLIDYAKQQAFKTVDRQKLIKLCTKLLPQVPLDELADLQRDYGSHLNLSELKTPLLLDFALDIAARVDLTNSNITLSL